MEINKLLLAFFFILCSNFCCFSQKNKYEIYFDSNGKIKSINTDNLVPIDEKIDFNIYLEYNDSLLNANYKPFIEKQIRYFNFLKNSEFKKDLIQYYGFNDTDFKTLLTETSCFLKGIPDNFLENLGYEKLKDLGDKDPNCDNLKTTFNPYYLLVIPNIGDPVKIELKNYQNGYLFGEKKDIEISTDNKTSIKYKLFFNLPEPSLISSKIDFFPDIAKYETIKEKIEEALSILDKIKNINKPGTNKFKHIDEKAKFIRELTTLEQQIKDYFISQKETVKKWLWYSQGINVLNPFVPSSNDSKSKILFEELKNFRSDSLKVAIKIATLEKKLEFLKETYKSNLKEKITLEQAKDFFIPEVNVQIDTLAKNLIKLEEIKSKINEAIKSLKILKNNEKNNILGAKNIFCYDGLVFPQINNESKIFIRNYDAKNNYTLLQNAKNSYFENEKVHLLIENSNQISNLKNTVSPIQDKSPFSNNIENSVNEFNKFNFNDVLASLKNIPKSITPVEEKNNEFDIYNSQIVNIIKILKNIKYFSENILIPPQFSSGYFNDLTPKFKTVNYPINFPDTAKSSYFLNSFIREESGKIDTVKFIVNKLYHILPSIGFANNFAKRPEVLLNSNGTLKEVNYYQGVGVMISLKIYPFSTFVRDPKFIYSNKRIPNFDYRKWHFLMGFNGLKPLKQFYLGSGIDLWSGISLNFGSFIINKKQEKFVENKLESKNYLDWKNLYCSINFDISVATKLINLFKN